MCSESFDAREFYKIMRSSRASDGSVHIFVLSYALKSPLIVLFFGQKSNVLANCNLSKMEQCYGRHILVIILWVAPDVSCALLET